MRHDSASPRMPSPAGAPRVAISVRLSTVFEQTDPQRAVIDVILAAGPSILLAERIKGCDGQIRRCKPSTTGQELSVFVLDQRLLQDTVPVGDFPLSRLLLSNDSQYPWFILVPRRADISEVFQLSEADQAQLWSETNSLSQTLQRLFNADKMNVAALGNVVSQLHMHVIVRHKTDVAWPAPVWGKHPAVPYSAAQSAAIIARLKDVLVEDFTFVEGQV